MFRVYGLEEGGREGERERERDGQNNNKGFRRALFSPSPVSEREGLGFKG